MDFIPSVGPGYEDTAVRPWNKVHTQKRENGDYYSVYFQKAISLRPKFITVTSFNEWHEGTQIEPAGKGIFSRLQSTFAKGQNFIENLICKRFSMAFCPGSQLDCTKKTSGNTGYQKFAKLLKLVKYNCGPTIVY